MQSLMKGKDFFQSTVNIIYIYIYMKVDKGAVKLSFATLCSHVKESYKACEESGKACDNNCKAPWKYLTPFWKMFFFFFFCFCEIVY